MASSTIGFVWGYLPGIDTQSQPAIEAGLPQRFSLAFNRYPDSGPGFYVTEFDRDLIVGTMNCLLQIFSYDSLVAEDLKGESHSSLPEACLTDEENGGYDSFNTIRLAKDDTLVCYVEHEAYESCGGPHPYHDAYVYAFYCGYIERSAVQNVLFAHASGNDILVLDVISGAQQPIKPSWWRRKLSW